MLLWIKIDLVRIGTMRVQIKIWSVLDAILQMILYRVVIYSSLVEQRGRGKMCVWHFRHGMEGYLLYRNAISSLFAWFYAEDRLQLPSWPLNLARLWEEQVGRTILWPLDISFTSEVQIIFKKPNLFLWNPLVWWNSFSGYNPFEFFRLCGLQWSLWSFTAVTITQISLRFFPALRSAILWVCKFYCSP